MRFQPGPGTIEQHPEVSDIREVTRADLAILSEKRPQGFVQSLRDSHHRIARACASGLSNGDITTTCGISNTRLVTLRQDPAFIDLVAHYRTMITAEWAQNTEPVLDLLIEARQKSLSMLVDKIDDAADKNEFLPTRDLIATAELGLDRTGYGKVQKNLNINVDFAAKLESARKRSTSVRTIEGSTHPRALNVEQGSSQTIAPAPRALRRL